nr:hypothetical protein [Tanacetum cinerariifolium]
PVDYPADRGDDSDDEEESSEDDENEEDDEIDVEADEEEEHPAPADSVVVAPTAADQASSEEEEEEEHPAPADSVVVAPTVADQAPSVEETEPFETDESPATPPPHPAYRTTARISIPTLIPFPPIPLTLSPPSPILAPAPPLSHIRSLGYRAAMIRLRDEAASTSHSPQLQLPSVSRMEDKPEVTLPPRKRLDIALGPRYEVGESSSAAAARPAGGFRADYGFVATVDREIMRDPEREVGYGITDSWDEIMETLQGAPDSTDTELGGYVREFETRVRQDMDKIYMRLDDEQTERQLLVGRLSMLFRDRRPHAYTRLLMEAEARMSREAWTRATDASDLVHGELPSASRREDIPEVTLPPRKRLDIAFGPRYEVGESSSTAAARPAGGLRAGYSFVATVDREIMRDPEREVGYGITDSWDEIVETLQGAPVSTDTELGRYVREFETRVRQDTDEIYMRLDDEQTERQLLAGRLNMLFRDRRAHAYTCHLMETKARMSREAWVRATDASDLVHGEVMSLRTTVLSQMSEIRKLQAADRRRQIVISELLRIDHRRSTEISELRTALQGQVTALQGQEPKELPVFLNGVKEWSLSFTSATALPNIKSSMLRALFILLL